MGQFAHVVLGRSFAYETEGGITPTPCPCRSRKPYYLKQSDWSQIENNMVVAYKIIVEPVTTVDNNIVLLFTVCLFVVTGKW